MLSQGFPNNVLPPLKASAWRYATDSAFAVETLSDLLEFVKR